MNSLVSATAHSDTALKTHRRPLARLLGLAPAAPTLSGLFTVWAGPLAALAAAAAGDRPPTPRGRARRKLLLSLTLASLLALALGGPTTAQPSTLGSATWAAPADQTTPAVSAIDPAAAANDIDTAVTITGAGLAATPTASLGTTALTHVTYVNSTTLTATVPWGMNPGVYKLTVVNPDGGTATLASAFTVTQGIGQWNGGNLFGGEVRQILMKPGDPNTLYAPAYGIVGLFRSQDAGEHWTYVSADVSINNGKFAIDPLHADWIYGYAVDGLYRSKDEGDTWTKLMPSTWPDGRAFDNGQVYVSPHNPQVLFIGSYCQPGEAHGALGLIKSTDGGASWSIVADMEGLAVQDVAFDPTVSSQKMVLATSDGHVHQSTDGGDHWGEVTRPPLSTMGFGSITYNPYRPAEVWIVSSSPGGIYKSTDAAFSDWQHVAWAGGAGTSYVTFTGPDSVYISAHHSADGGLTWQQFGPMTSSGQLTFDPTDLQIGYIGDDMYGVQKTTDGGQTWEVRNQGLAGMHCYSLEASRADPLRVLATFVSWPGVYRSDDGTNNWTFLPIIDSGNVWVVHEDPFDPQRLYVSSDSGFYVSTDGGESWSDLGWNLPASSPAGMKNVMEPDPHQPGHLLVGLRTGGPLIGGRGLLYASSDHGVTWQSIVMPQDLNAIEGIAFDPETPGLVYLSTSGTGVYRSTDSGTTWTRIDDQQHPLQGVSNITIATHPGHVLFAGALDPCRSLDGGATWECVGCPPGGASAYMFADGDSTRLYAATSAGLYFSSDAGDSWTRAAGALGTLQILALGYADANGHTILYAATSGGVAGTASSTAATSHAVPSATSGLVNAGIYRYVLGGAGTYHAITPKRVLDTRNGTGGLSGPFTNHAARTFTVSGGSSGVPSNATAVTGNLTVTGQTSNGYLFVGPVATNNPTSSTLNFPAGDDRANAVTVAPSAGGTLSITFVAPSNGPTAQAIFDVTGYFTPDTTGATYHAVTPARALDTRSGTGGLSGPFTNHAARTFTVSGIPSGATAVTGNLTVTGQTSNGYLFIGPVATNNPTSSTLNFPAGDDRANAVTVALSNTGALSITFVAPSNGPTAQAIFDVTGYFTSDMTGAVYVPLSPARLLDTRNGTGGLLGPFTNHAARTFTVSGGSSGVPSNATAVTGNLTVTGQTSSGYLFIGPTATNNPTSSTLNFPVGDDRANAVAVALSGTGSLSITFVAPSNGPSAQGIFDVTGYFAPAGG